MTDQRRVPPSFPALFPLFLALSAALSLSPAAFSEEAQTIHITGGRSAVPGIQNQGLVTVIERDYIEQSNARTLTELLSGQAGVQVTDLYGDGLQATVDMRGFGETAGRNVLVLVDGRRLNNSGDLANPAIHRISLQQIERIEIVRGSAGVLLGNQAVGGVINIVTRGADLPSSFLEAGGGSYDTLSGSFGLSRNLTDDLSLRINGDYFDTDNYRDNNETRTRRLDARLENRHENGLFYFEAHVGDDFQQNPGALFEDELAQDRRQVAGAYLGDYSDTEARMVTLGLDHGMANGWRMTGDLTWRKEDRDFVTSFRAFPGAPATQKRELWTFYPRIAGKLNERTDLTLGVDIEGTDYDLRTQFGPQLVDQTIWGVFGQAVVNLDPHWDLDLGLRYTEVDDTITTNSSKDKIRDGRTLGSIAVNYDPENNWRLFARADQNVRFPTVDEHTNIVFGQPVGLDTQHGISYEAGAQWSDTNLDLAFTLYQLNLDNEISFSADKFTNINLDQTRRTGATLEASWMPAMGWVVGGQYTYTDGKITDGPFDGNRIPLVARHSGRLFARGRFNDDFTGFAEAVYTGDRPLGADYGNDFAPLEAFTLINAALTYERKGWQVRVRVDNLLNEKFNASGAVGFDDTFTRRAAFFPAPERSFSLTARYDF